MSKHTTESNFNNDDSSGSMAMLNSTDRSNVKPYGGATYNEIEEDYVLNFKFVKATAKRSLVLHQDFSRCHYVCTYEETFRIYEYEVQQNI